MSQQDELLSRLIEFRRDLHRHPELAWQEERTCAQIAEQLDRLGIGWKKLTGTGIVAELEGQRPGPWIALRADMDALPIQEENRVDYASTRDGMMHACGHDGHTTILLGAAELLRDCRLELPVRLIFQPAEETGQGALAMIEHGALEDVAAIFSGHIDHLHPAGTIVAVAGAVNASTDGFSIRIITGGGHSARPHEGRDALVVGCYLVTALQTLVSRELNPADPGVITVGRFNAGTAGNIMAGQAELRGTIRTLKPAVREQLSQGMQRMAAAAADLFEAEIVVEIHRGTPALINQGIALAAGQRAAAHVVGEENLRPLATTNMGGEDFAHYLAKIPGCFVRWGARLPQGKSHPAHSSRFDFDERVLLVGARYLSAVAQEAAAVFRDGKTAT